MDETSTTEGTVQQENSVPEVPQVVFDGSAYFEGTLRQGQSVTLNAGDRIQVWFNDRRRMETDGEGRLVKKDPVLYVKVLGAGKKKGVDLSQDITGVWRKDLKRKQN